MKPTFGGKYFYGKRSCKIRTAKENRRRYELKERTSSTRGKENNNKWAMNKCTWNFATEDEEETTTLKEDKEKLTPSIPSLPSLVLKKHVEVGRVFQAPRIPEKSCGKLSVIAFISYAYLFPSFFLSVQFQLNSFAMQMKLANYGDVFFMKNIHSYI